MLDPEIFIRKVKKTELFTLQKIGKITFVETFGAANSAEDMETFLQDSFSTSRMEIQLNNPDSQFYFVEFNKTIVGYLKINKDNAQTERKLDKALEIERIYVLKEYHGKKIGKLLMEKALKIAKLENYERVWLGVWERNLKAISFYKKFGFTKFDTHLFMVGNDAQTDILMKLELN